MKKITLLLALTFLMGCGVKQTRNYLMSGDYDSAINNAVENLRNNKERKGKQDYIYLLEEAFAKAKERDLEQVSLLKKENNPAQLEKIYTTYVNLEERQQKIKPLLPLFLMKENRNAIFPFNDYSDQIVKSKTELSKYLYANSKALLGTNNKMNCRRAYDDFAYLDKINPNYKDVRGLMNEAMAKGLDYVNVFAKNETNMVIPQMLQNDLLDINTYGLDDKWTVYHNNRQKNVNYDYGLIVNFRQINISPEQVKEREFVKERQIKVGTKKLLDAQGNAVRDSKGNFMMVDDLQPTRVSIYEFGQFKSVQVVAKVDYVDFKTNQLLQSFPLESTFNFQNTYATFKGDRRAADDDYISFFDRRALPFPSSEQMVFECGEDLKSKLKSIINRNRFRN
jgi:hypothetical protein